MLLRWGMTKKKVCKIIYKKREQKILNFIKNIIHKTLRVGILATDSETLQLKKISITMVPVIIAPVGKYSKVSALIIFSVSFVAGQLTEKKSETDNKLSRDL